ncbi:hypothetical protein J3D55_003066 [Chryseobacterium ginsenosidimutans]|uniref:hypothetical protein n=1 Tax=Chryseobacterium ginsenosidimutans TaxID=687846 RepID=UPI002167D36D|nr:hypothetical protein [Chryseobacterium ginsenosidimutans]MCS3870150.1 hypothetical protein [Chryseobacterium ginsenosidimutans]
MKKMLFIVALGVAGLASAKGNEKVNTEKKAEKKAKTEQKAPVRQCGVAITYWSGGQVIGYQTVYSDQPDLGSCQAWQTGVQVALWASGWLVSNP